MSKLTLQQSINLGVALGITGSALLFFTVPAYHNMVVWQWTHYWALAPFGVAGVALGWWFDK